MLVPLRLGLLRVNRLIGEKVKSREMQTQVNELENRATRNNKED